MQMWCDVYVLRAYNKFTPLKKKCSHRYYVIHVLSSLVFFSFSIFCPSILLHPDAWYTIFANVLFASKTAILFISRNHTDTHPWMWETCVLMRRIPSHSPSIKYWFTAFAEAEAQRQIESESTDDTKRYRQTEMMWKWKRKRIHAQVIRTREHWSNAELLWNDPYEYWIAANSVWPTQKFINRTKAEKNLENSYVNYLGSRCSSMFHSVRQNHSGLGSWLFRLLTLASRGVGSPSGDS